MTIRRVLIVCVVLATSLTATLQVARAFDDIIAADRKVEPFAPSAVKLLPSPFKDAQDKNSQYLLSVDVDRLLSRLRENGGLEPKARRYEGWESQSIAGHSLGHYLSAVSKSYAATGDERFKERAAYIVSELDQIQTTSGSGLLAGDKRYFEVFDQIARGDIRSQGFDLNGLWVPWYVLHKIFAGLLDAYRYCDDETALVVAKRLGDWGIDTLAELNYGQMQKMLACEHGGTNHAYYNLYAATGDERYLRQGDRFYHAAILDPLRRQEDQLAGKHANTQFPKLIGLARRAQLHDVEDTLDAEKTVEFFWKRVVQCHSYAIGGNSMNEHFGEPNIIAARLNGNTCETCNSYNMLHLSQLLYERTGDPRYIDFFERALYNHILASLNHSDDPEKLYTYYVPLQTGSFRTYSDREHTWTCCHGTGMENHAQYNTEIYYHSQNGNEETLYVNLMIPSTLTWQEKELTVTLQGDGKFIICAQKPQKLSIKARIPCNCKLDDDANLKVDADGYVLLGDEWQIGTRQIDFPLQACWQIESPQDDPNLVTLRRGPILYCAVLGSTEQTLVASVDELDDAPNAIVIPTIVSEEKSPEAFLAPDAFQTTSFFELPKKVTLTATEPKPVELIPFYCDQERYALYFEYATPERWQTRQEEIAQARELRLKRQAATIDFFQPGEMQAERNANFDGVNTNHGEYRGRKWRDATDGYFEFDLKVDPEKDCRLLATYWGDESGNRNFKILADGKQIGQRKLLHDRPGKFFFDVYVLPKPSKGTTLRIRMESVGRAMVGGLFEARVVDKNDLKLFIDDVIIRI